MHVGVCVDDENAIAYGYKIETICGETVILFPSKAELVQLDCTSKKFHLVFDPYTYSVVKPETVVNNAFERIDQLENNIRELVSLVKNQLTDFVISLDDEVKFINQVKEFEKMRDYICDKYGGYNPSCANCGGETFELYSYENGIGFCLHCNEERRNREYEKQGCY